MKAVRAAVIGTGAWGTALAKSIAEKDIPAVIWCRGKEQAAGINSAHENPRYLEGVRLPENLSATNSAEQLFE